VEAVETRDLHRSGISQSRVEVHKSISSI